MRCNMVLVAALAVVLGGCKGEAFSTKPGVAATADGQELTAERVAAILTSAKGIKLEPMAADFVANLWVDYMLFAQAVAKGDLKTDSVTVAEALWPGIADARSRRWHDTVVARRAKVTDAQIDSAFAADQSRAVQHILVSADKNASADIKAAARKKADSLLTVVRGGGDFAAIARQHSQDPGSAAKGGIYPPAPKGQWAPEFDKAIWSLTPGQISGIVTTDFGYHIIRRPTATESRDLWRTALSEAQVPTIDSLYFEETIKSANMKVANDAVAHMRAALADLDDKRDDKSKLITYDGGEFRTTDFVRWVRAITGDPGQGPQRLEQFRAAPDSDLVNFAKRLTESALVLRDAEKNNIQLTAEEWKQLQTTFAAEIDSIKVHMGLTAEALDSTASEKDRRKAAALKVDQYFDALVSGKERLRVLPGMLAYALRGKQDFSINQTGLKRGLDLALEKQKADSTANAGTNPAPMQPAPGPAPVQGATPPSAVPSETTPKP